MIRTETNRNCNALSMRDRSKKKIAVPKGVRRQLAATSTGPIRLGDSAAARKRRERERPPSQATSHRDYEFDRVIGTV
jgi:hypothetical protein